jgi:VanZ family protein/DNA-binding CsgD family transcriptional regulator
MEYMDETTLAHKHTSPWLIAFRIIFTIALVWCILFIFHNSLETSSISSARSHEVMQKINAILAHLNIGPLSEHVVRKLAHFSEFTLEGFLLMLCLRVYTRRFVRHVSWPMLCGMATALLDETIQLYVPGRTSSVRDVWIDFGGVIAGLFVALLLLLIVRGLTSFHAMKKENRRLRAERAELLRQHYRLSARETEVMELIAHGNTVARIAEDLVVSENTIRTHSKRIYTKLDIHKKQELLDLIDSFDPSELGD